MSRDFYKVFKKKGANWKHTNNNSRNDFYNTERSFCPLHLALGSTKPTCERSLLLSSGTVLSKEIMGRFFRVSVPFSLLRVFLYEIAFEQLPKSIKQWFGWQKDKTGTILFLKHRILFEGLRPNQFQVPKSLLTSMRFSSLALLITVLLRTEQTALYWL